MKYVTHLVHLFIIHLSVHLFHSLYTSLFIFFNVYTRAKLLQSCPTLCNTVDCSPPGSSVCGYSPGKNIEVGCHALLQGTFPTQGSKPRLFYLLHCVGEGPTFCLPQSRWGNMICWPSARSHTVMVDLLQVTHISCASWEVQRYVSYSEPGPAGIGQSKTWMHVSQALCGQAIRFTA